MPGPDVTHARTVSHWEASYRPENSPRSKRIKTLLAHDWEFRRDPATGQAFMQGHTVTKFEYLPGFAPDDTQEPPDPHLDASLGRPLDLTSPRELTEGRNGVLNTPMANGVPQSYDRLAALLKDKKPRQTLL